MIQFVEMNREGYNSYEFGFYDTISDTIISFNGSMTWESEDDFIEDFEAERGGVIITNSGIKRFTDKISSKFKQ